MDRTLSAINTSVNRLRQYLSMVAQGQLPESLRLFRDTRMVLESLGAQSSFPILQLYCNWILHPEITQSSAARRILTLINEHMLEVMVWRPGEPVNDEVQTAVARALQIRELRHELRSLYATNDIRAPFLDSYSGWQNVLAGVFFELLEKPLRFPSREDPSLRKGRRGQLDRAEEEIRNKWEARKGNSEYMIDELRFQLLPPIGAPHGALSELYWVISMRREEYGKGTIDICSQVLPAEPSSAFEID